MRNILTLVSLSLALTTGTGIVSPVVQGRAAPAARAAPPAPIAWRTRWSPSLFAQAAREHRFVLLDLHAVWCHWCHVMDEKTYQDAKVVGLIGARYLAVSVDADSDPELASRYGEWGWPATIVLAADGTEIVKRRGFIPPQQMASLLQAIIDDPSPGPSVRLVPPLTPVAGGAALEAQRTALRRTYDAAYDARNGGWGSGQKFLDAPTVAYTLALALAERDPTAEHRARQTLDANLKLIDPVWGGVYQYSENIDWTSPHFEKLVSFQADDLRLYSLAYARWHDPRYLAAARNLRRYMNAFLRSPEGAYYVSQDADLSAGITGHDYYALDDGARRRRGIPHVDTHVYARENGWAIRALCAFHDVTGEGEALDEATTAARWVLAHRALLGGGFRHDEIDSGGPFLEDTLSMGTAFLALYRSSGERQWLARARAAMADLERQFRDPQAGYVAAQPPAGAAGVFRHGARTIEQNAAVARLANILERYTADARYREAALHAMVYVNAALGDGADQLHADVLLADLELGTPPIHITVVGARSDPAARALHAAALEFPAVYLQVDWWDRAEGPLPNPQVQYPLLARAAAFACTQSTCSNPVFDPGGIAPTVLAALDQ